MPHKKFQIALPAILLLLATFVALPAQDAQPLLLTADGLADGKQITLDTLAWKYRAGDDLEWANPDFDDSGWKTSSRTVIKPDDFPDGEWNGRAWFRLRFNVDESVKADAFALIIKQTGASEIFLDGKRIARFGAITETGDFEFNPNGLPILFRPEAAGEHVLAVRSSNSVFADKNSAKARWLTNGGIYPFFSATVRLADDAAMTTLQYANSASMRVGFFFIGILIALAFLHFLLYIFYRADRANLFYSLYALAFAFNMVCGNLRAFGHQGVMSNAVLRIISVSMLAAMFVFLLAFLRTAFEAALGRIFWILGGIWLITVSLNAVYFNILGSFRFLGNIAIFLSFSYSIFLVIEALRHKRADAWILLIGVQVFALGMFSTLLNQFSLLRLPGWIFEIGEFALILAVPIAVSIFLARSVARTNLDLKTQLAQVETLSAQKIVQERRSAELHAENERRAKELEEARQLQLSMLPTKLPQLPDLEIAAYMKPATEVGGDYYDFHVSSDGTLTVAVGDATGHGLKAGSVVTATKSLFNAFAGRENISQILSRTSGALKKMNLRGLFMALALAKIKDGEMKISIAGMPSALIFRAAAGKIEEINIRAMPLGSISRLAYTEQKISLFSGDVVLLMSDGFPEMFNEAGEMLGFEKAAEVLPEIAHHAPQEIIDRLVRIGHEWAGSRPADDDVTFVALKIRTPESENGN